MPHKIRYCYIYFISRFSSIFSSYIRRELFDDTCLSFLLTVHISFYIIFNIMFQLLLIFFFPLYVCVCVASLEMLKLSLWAKSLSCVQLFATPWTVAHQAPLSMGFSRQEYWSGLPCPPPGDRPNPGIEPRSTSLQVDSLLSEPPKKPILV